jgi:hypothetical protein
LAAPHAGAAAGASLAPALRAFLPPSFHLDDPSAVAGGADAAAPMAGASTVDGAKQARTARRAAR